MKILNRSHQIKGLVLTVLLTVAGLGAECPGSTSTKQAQFKNANFDSVIRSLSEKTWTGPTIVDQGAVDLSDDDLAFDHSCTVSPSTDYSDFSMTVAALGEKNFMTIFTKSDGDNRCTNSSTSQLYSVGNTDISSNAWSKSDDLFTQIDVNVGYDSQEPLSVVDADGNLTVVSRSHDLANFSGERKLIAMRYLKQNGNWLSAVDISPGISASVRPLNHAVDVASNNQVVSSFVISSGLYFNDYLDHIGWRYTSTNNIVGRSIHYGANPVYTYGTDIGFDSYGNGYVAYVENDGGNRDIWLGRYSQTKATRFDSTDASLYREITTAVDQGYPRLAVFADGSASVFYYHNYDAVDSSQLFMSYSAARTSASSGNFSVPSRFDSSVGSGASSVYMEDAGGTRPLAVKTSGQYGAAAFVKSDGIAKRVYVFQATGSNAWTSLGAVDGGGAGSDAFYTDVAVNSLGHIGVVWAATSALDGYEHLYSKVYRDGAWSSLKQLDQINFTGTSTLMVTYQTYMDTGKPRPTISIDSAGNVVVLYSVLDNNTPNRNRMAISVYK